MLTINLASLAKFQLTAGPEKYIEEAKSMIIIFQKMIVLMQLVFKIDFFTSISSTQNH